jgi:hypothetical protein
MKKNSWPVWLLLLSSLLISGCTTTITNLTPSTQKRNANGLYPFEVVLDTRENSLRQQTLKPFVLIGTQAYAMQRAPMLSNRWETLVPIPANKEFINYRYKFNYEYNCIPRPKPGSKLSPPYQLQVLDRR